MSLPEILHELIDAGVHRLGLDRAAELHELADKLDPPVEAEPGPAEADAVDQDPAASAAPGA